MHTHTLCLFRACRKARLRQQEGWGVGSDGEGGSRVEVPGRHCARSIYCSYKRCPWRFILACHSDENVTLCVWIILHLLEVGREIFTCARTFKKSVFILSLKF